MSLIWRTRGHHRQWSADTRWAGELSHDRHRLWPVILYTQTHIMHSHHYRIDASRHRFNTVRWASGRASGLQKLCDEVLAWLSVWSEVQMICIWSSWRHIISGFIKLQNGLIFLVPAYPSCPGEEAVKRMSAYLLPFWCCWLGDKKGIRCTPVVSRTFCFRGRPSPFWNNFGKEGPPPTSTLYNVS